MPSPAERSDRVEVVPVADLQSLGSESALHLGLRPRLLLFRALGALIRMSLQIGSLNVYSPSWLIVNLENRYSAYFGLLPTPRLI